MTNEIDVVKNGRVGEIVLNRPKKHNAMTPQMAVDLAAACANLDSDDAIRVVIIRGAGDKAFSSGSDLNALDEYSGSFDFRNRVEYATQIRNLRKPCIAAIKGWALGGGFEMALSADIRVASKNAKLGAPEVTLGWVGGGGASQMLPRLIGYGKSMLMLLEGSPVGAQEAYEMGIVEVLVEEGEELNKARELALRIAEHTPVALQTVKAAVRIALSTGLNEGLSYENEVLSLSFALRETLKNAEE